MIGSYVQVKLNDGSQLIGRSFLSNPKNANFVKITSFCSNMESRKPKNNLKIKELEIFDVIEEATEVDIIVVCQNVQTTLEFNPKLLLKSLNNIVFKTGFVIDFQPIFNDLGVEYVIIKEAVCLKTK